MQPYQEASEEIRRQGELPLTLAKKAGSLALSAGTAAIGGGIFTKILPFLNKYIPQDIALKGLNKINPGFGKFFSKAMASGQTFEEARDFIGEKIQKETADKTASEEAKLESLKRAKEAKKKGSGKEAFVERELARVQGQNGQQGQNPQSQAALQPQQQPQQGGQSDQVKQQLLQAMQALSQQLKT